MSYFKWRIIEPWNDPDGMNVWSPSKSFLTWEDMKNPRPGTKTASFVKDCREWGYNGIAFNFDPDKNPGALKAFAAYLAENGISTFIRRDWGELEGKNFVGGRGRATDHASSVDGEDNGLDRRREAL